ncbi:MAG: hypothetical protein HQK87_02475 [Nitrospinae bacterium]|nr:hypothetical protein [Nitrospinota bacterium]
MAVTSLVLSACGGATGSDSSPQPVQEFTCKTRSKHASRAYTACLRDGCHSHRTLSYGGSAPEGTVVTIIEDGGAVYRLIANSQQNFCMRSKDGGNPEGGYTAEASARMNLHPQNNGSCASSGCHDDRMPIY